MPSADPSPPGPDGLWAAPLATGPVQAVVTLPGSKSLTNRYLVLSAHAQESSRLRSPLRSRDTLLMAQALRELGCEVGGAPDQPADWIVTPHTLRGGGTVDCGLAGNVMRFVPPVAALAAGPVAFIGDAHAAARPMSVILEALRALGVEIDDEGRGSLPFTVRGRGAVRGGAVTLDASASSQFVSGLLLSGPRFEHGLTVHHDGKSVPSLPHIEMTMETLRDAGEKVPAQLRTEVEDKIRALRNTLDSDDVTLIQNRSAELNVALQQVGQAMYQAGGDGGTSDEDVVEGEYRTE